MKKVKISTKLELNKKSIVTLNEQELDGLKGGGFLSIGKKCSRANNCSRLHYKTKCPKVMG